MPLNTEVLKTTLQNALMANLTDDDRSQSDQVEQLAVKIADAMTAFVQSATITYATGLIAPPSGGPVTGVFTNTIS